MDSNETNTVSKETLDFFEKYLSSGTSSRNIRHNNEKAINSALIYERFRVALEYQEEHLIFKNAISRIIRRKYVLSSSITADKLFSDLINELSWANYINPESLPKEETERIKNILERYLVLLKYSQSVYLSKHELQKKIVNWLACEIEELLEPDPGSSTLVEYAYNTLRKNLETTGVRLSEKENEIQLKLAIFILLYKPDTSLIEYWIIKDLYPNFKEFSVQETKKFALSFEPNNNAINKVIYNRYRTRYLQYAKRNVVPFILIKNLPKVGKIDLKSLKDNTSTLKNNLLHIYDNMTTASQEKVWRGTFRALIFILLSKISLAFILELPFDRFISDEINYLSLGINVCLPPVLMLFMGTFVKSPGGKNRQVVEKSIENIFFSNQVDNKKFKLKISKPSSIDKIFNFMYSLFSLAILGLVIWGLLILKFNILSILLFFLFVSAVSFFSFRIRNIASELLMSSSQENTFTSVFEFLLLPFIRMGKYISERFARTNPFILALDFLIEAPLKTIIKIANSWLHFVNAKKEEIEF